MGGGNSGDVSHLRCAGEGPHADGSAAGSGASSVGLKAEAERSTGLAVEAGEVAVDELADELARLGLGGDVVVAVLEENLGSLLHLGARVIGVESTLVSDGVAVGPDVLGDVTVKGVSGDGTSVNVREAGLEVVNDGAVKLHGRGGGVLDNNGALHSVSLVAGKVLAVVLDVVGAGDAHVDDIAGDLDGVGKLAINPIGAECTGVGVLNLAGSFVGDLFFALERDLGKAAVLDHDGASNLLLVGAAILARVGAHVVAEDTSVESPGAPGHGDGIVVDGGIAVVAASGTGGDTVEVVVSTFAGGKVLGAVAAVLLAVLEDLGVGTDEVDNGGDSVNGGHLTGNFGGGVHGKVEGVVLELTLGLAHRGATLEVKLVELVGDGRPEVVGISLIFLDGGGGGAERNGNGEELAEGSSVEGILGFSAGLNVALRGGVRFAALGVVGDVVLVAFLDVGGVTFKVDGR